MKYEEIMKLVDAGFKADQIMKLAEMGAPAEPAPADPEPAPVDPEPTPAPTDPAPAEPEKSKLDEMSEKFSNSVAKFEENLNSLTKAFQDNNILLSNIDEGEQLTPDQQLARLLDGKREEKPKKF